MKLLEINRVTKLPETDIGKGSLLTSEQCHFYKKIDLTIEKLPLLHKYLLSVLV